MQTAPDDEGARVLADTLSAIINELIASRLRNRALLEILADRGIASADEIDARTETVFRRDWNDLVAQLLPPEVGGAFRRDWQRD